MLVSLANQGMIITITLKTIANEQYSVKRALLISLLKRFLMKTILKLHMIKWWFTIMKITTDYRIDDILEFKKIILVVATNGR